jgi:Mce-associated membrane protein
VTASAKRKEQPQVRRTWILINWGLVVLIVAGLGSAAWFGSHWYDDSQRDGDRAAALDAASNAVVTVMSLSPDSIDGDIAKIKSMATGDFAEEFAKGEDTVRDRVIGGSQETKPEILKTAYVKGDADSATVILAVDAITSFTKPIDDGKGKGKDKDKVDGDSDGDGIPDPITSHFRVKAEMALIDGEWRIAELDIA